MIVDLTKAQIHALLYAAGNFTAGSDGAQMGAGMDRAMLNAESKLNAALHGTGRRAVARLRQQYPYDKRLQNLIACLRRGDPYAVDDILREYGISADNDTGRLATI